MTKFSGQGFAASSKGIATGMKSLLQPARNPVARDSSVSNLFSRLVERIEKKAAEKLEGRLNSAGITAVKLVVAPLPNLTNSVGVEAVSLWDAPHFVQTDLGDPKVAGGGDATVPAKSIAIVAVPVKPAIPIKPAYPETATEAQPGGITTKNNEPTTRNAPLDGKFAKTEDRQPLPVSVMKEGLATVNRPTRVSAEESAPKSAPAKIETLHTSPVVTTPLNAAMPVVTKAPVEEKLVKTGAGRAAIAPKASETAVLKDGPVVRPAERAALPAKSVHQVRENKPTLAPTVKDETPSAKSAPPDVRVVKVEEGITAPNQPTSGTRVGVDEKPRDVVAAKPAGRVAVVTSELRKDREPAAVIPSRRTETAHITPSQTHKPTTSDIRPEKVTSLTAAASEPKSAPVVSPPAVEARPPKVVPSAVQTTLQDVTTARQGTESVALRKMPEPTVTTPTRPIEQTTPTRPVVALSPKAVQPLNARPPEVQVAQPGVKEPEITQVETIRRVTGETQPVRTGESRPTVAIRGLQDNHPVTSPVQAKSVDTTTKHADASSKQGAGEIEPPKTAEVRPVSVTKASPAEAVRTDTSADKPIRGGAVEQPKNPSPQPAPQVATREVSSILTGARSVVAGISMPAMATPALGTSSAVRIASENQEKTGVRAETAERTVIRSNPVATARIDTAPTVNQGGSIPSQPAIRSIPVEAAKIEQALPVGQERSIPSQATLMASPVVETPRRSGLTEKINLAAPVTVQGTMPQAEQADKSAPEVVKVVSQPKVAMGVTAPVVQKTPGLVETIPGAVLPAVARPVVGSTIAPMLSKPVLRRETPREALAAVSQKPSAEVLSALPVTPNVPVVPVEPLMTVLPLKKAPESPTQTQASPAPEGAAKCELVSIPQMATQQASVQASEIGYSASAPVAKPMQQSPKTAQEPRETVTMATSSAYQPMTDARRELADAFGAARKSVLQAVPPQSVSSARTAVVTLEASAPVQKPASVVKRESKEIAQPTAQANSANNTDPGVAKIAPTEAHKADSTTQATSAEKTTPLPVPVKVIASESIVATSRGLNLGGHQTIELQLNPEALGRAVAFIKRELGGLSLSFEIERPEARRAVEAEVTTLRESLAAAGFSNVSIEVKAPESRSATSEFASGDRRSQTGGERQEQAPQRHEKSPEPQRKPIARRLGNNSFEIIA